MSTENNSVPCISSTFVCANKLYRDGDVKDINTNLGDITFTTIYPVKYIFLDVGRRGCRKRPYNSEILHEVSSNIYLKCPKPCRPKMTFGRRLDKIMQHLPHCSNNEETRCFDATVLEAQSHVLAKPCIKIEYRTDGGKGFFPP